MLDLLIYKPNGKQHQLGIYQSIHAGFLAVHQQQTGLEQWDQLDPNQLPYQLFDLTCWNYESFSGTRPYHSCSKATG
ncbi:MAG TPA: hypothetical protein DCX06_13980 [Opitutae bacterium]|nr:hypothetical protein [Opitutae bacterium]